MTRVAPRAVARLTGEIARDHVSQGSFALVAAAVALGYSILLPFAFTQRLSLHNWRYLDARYLAFSVAFGLSAAWLLAASTVAGPRRSCVSCEARRRRHAERSLRPCGGRY